MQKKSKMIIAGTAGILMDLIHEYDASGNCVKTALYSPDGTPRG